MKKRELLNLDNLPYILKKLEELFANKLDKAELMWSKIAGKPESFPPSSHAHDWNSITSKPGTFPPSTHTHDYISTSASCNKNWNWAWGSGTPTHIWGSQGSSSDFYVYSPDSINAGYAKKAGASGSSTFAGNKTARTIAHGLGRIPVYVGVTPSADPAGNLGEHWATCDATNIYVYNSGSGTTAFKWFVV